MALVSAGFFANVQVVDAAGNRAAVNYELVAADIDTAGTNAAALVADLDPLTDGVILGYTVGQKFAEDTTFFGAAGSEVENIALVTAKIDSPELEFASFRVPAPVDALFVGTSGPNRNIVLSTYAALQTYLGNFITTTGIATVSDGETIENPATAGNVKGKRIHRGSRKG